MGCSGSRGGNRRISARSISSSSFGPTGRQSVIVSSLILGHTLFRNSGRDQRRPPRDRLGITTPLELRDADHRLIRERLGVVLERMVLELRGVACLGLEELTPDRKSLIASRSFGKAVETRRGLEEAVSVYTARAAEKMRRQNLATASIAAWIQTNNFKPNEKQYSASKAVRLPVATADTGKLIAAATAGLGVIFKQAGLSLQEGRRDLPRSGAGRSRAGRPVRSSRRCALDASHARDRSAQRAFRPRRSRLRHGRRSPQLGITAGIHLAALHDGVGRTFAGVGEGRRQRCADALRRITHGKRSTRS
jgi:hypothetical protein